MNEPNRLEDLQPGARVSGVLPNIVVEVVQTEWHGTEALTLTYRDDHGRSELRADALRASFTFALNAVGETLSLDGALSDAPKVMR
jgi:hypothetical protein